MPSRTNVVFEDKTDPSLPDAAPLSDRPRCGGRESKFLAASGRRSLPDLQSLRPHPLADPQPHHHR